MDTTIVIQTRSASDPGSHHKMAVSWVRRTGARNGMVSSHTEEGKKTPKEKKTHGVPFGRFEPGFRLGAGIGSTEIIRVLGERRPGAWARGL